jgi:hypothetical protein
MEMTPWLLLTVLVVIAIAAPRYGVDSRWPAPGDLPTPRPRHRVGDDLTSIAHAARQAFPAHRARG